MSDLVDFTPAEGRLLLQSMVDDPHNVETLEKVNRYLQSQ